MSIERASLPDVSAWQVMSLRLTCFPLDTPIPLEQKWWEELLDCPADKVETDRTKGIRIEQGAIEQGAVDKGILRLSIEPLRIDWLLEAFFPEEVPDKIPTVDALPNAVERFAPIMRKWLPMCPQSLRLAFACQVIQPTESHKQAYTLLNLYLHHVQIDPDSTDFHYRVNRRRSSRSGIPDLAINRLSTWSAPEFTIRLRASRDGMKQPVDVVSKVFHAAMLELDVNTAPERQSPLPQDRLSHLLDELIDLAVEIASKGDIK